jgi:hypothetical protein
MPVIRSLAAALALGAGLAVSQPAFAAVPAEFTTQGIATSYSEGKAAKIPNTLFYSHGRIRVEMQPPDAGEAGSVFSVVLAKDGGDTITMLNTQEKQAISIAASSVESVTENPALAKISTFKLSEFGHTFKAQGKKIGTATVAGEPCTILEQNGKDGHFKLWLSDKYEIPMKFIYFEGNHPAFDYEVMAFTPKSNAGDGAFNVPSGYMEMDLNSMVRGQ